MTAFARYPVFNLALRPNIRPYHCWSKQIEGCTLFETTKMQDSFIWYTLWICTWNELRHEFIPQENLSFMTVPNKVEGKEGGSAQIITLFIFLLPFFYILTGKTGWSSHEAHLQNVEKHTWKDHSFYAPSFYNKIFFVCQTFAQKPLKCLIL